MGVIVAINIVTSATRAEFETKLGEKVLEMSKRGLEVEVQFAIIISTLSNNYFALLIGRERDSRQDGLMQDIADLQLKFSQIEES